MKIPLYKPSFGIEELEAAKRVLNSSCFTRGNEVASFENEFANYIGKKYAIAVTSGTSGLHLLIKASGWQSGDKIITSPFSYIATSNALLYEGIKPIFTDISEDTLNINPKNIHAEIHKDTKGILNVHILGLPSVLDNTKINNLTIIEDACEAIGQPSKKFPINIKAKAAVYSFHENKPITTGGEGGIITTDDPEIAGLCYSMRDQGRSNNSKWINMVKLGYNYRMTEIQAAIGRAQLKKLPKILAQRKGLAEKYEQLFKDQKEFKTPYQNNSIDRSWFTYFLIFKNVKTRNTVKNELEKIGVQTNANLFTPIHLFPHYKELGYREGQFPVSERIYKRILGIPFFTKLTFNQQKYIATIIKTTIRDMI